MDGNAPIASTGVAIAGATIVYLVARACNQLDTRALGEYNRGLALEPQSVGSLPCAGF